jgi:hypothetical protein
MTAISGNIVFNSSTGSDTQASGCGPATAVYGTGAATTASSAVVTGINTTGVSVGDLLWVDTASGRQFSVIASVDSGTQVTCDGTFANTASGLTWAIGGKRATFNNADSRTLFAQTNGAQPGWTIVTETNQTITGATSIGSGNACSGSYSAYITVKGDDPDNHRVINYSGTSSINIFSWGGGTEVQFENLKFTHSGASGTVTGIGFGSTAHAVIRNCIFGDSTNDLATGVYSGRRTTVSNCLFQNCTVRGIHTASNGAAFVDKCMFKDNLTGVDYNNTNSVQVYRSIFWGNTTYGINMAHGYVHTGPRNIVGCIFVDNASAIYNSTYEGWVGLNLQDNLFVGNTTACNNASSSQGNVVNFGGYNYFYDNGTNATNVALQPTDDTSSLTTDPFIDSASGDFTLNDTAGGGAVLRAAEQSVGISFMRPSRQWDVSSGSGGGGLIRVNANGGIFG